MHFPLAMTRGRAALASSDDSYRDLDGQHLVDLNMHPARRFSRVEGLFGAVPFVRDSACWLALAAVASASVRPVLSRPSEDGLFADSIRVVSLFSFTPRCSACRTSRSRAWKGVLACLRDGGLGCWIPPTLTGSLRWQSRGCPRGVLIPALNYRP